MILPSSLAAGVGAGIENQQFAVSASVIPQKNLIIGTYDAATYPNLAPNVPFRVYSAQDVGAQTGFGFMLHRLALRAFLPGVVETWIIPQAEAQGAAAASGSLDFTASSGIVAGTVALYIASIRYAVNTTAGMTANAIAVAVAAAINADKNCPVTASTGSSGLVTLTSKSKGPWGNFISLNFNLLAGDVTPSGVLCTVTAMTGGTGTPTISTALTALGTGDNQNQKNFTNVIHGYGSDTTTLDALSTYNGIGATGSAGLVGNYSQTVARPFRSLIGDTGKGSAGLTAVLAIAAGRLTDRTSGVISAPGSSDHPAEIAAEAVGIMAQVNSVRAEQGYIGQPLSCIPGSIADDWTATYTNRDQAVQGGVGTTQNINGVVTCQNLITFYRPANVNPADNAYRAMRNISIFQNILYNYVLNFQGAKWTGISIVADVTKVSNMTDRAIARDTDSVLDDLVALAQAFAGNGWLYSADYTLQQLATGTCVQTRDGLTGWDINFPIILSGEGGIYNSLILADTSIAVLQG